MTAKDDVILDPHRTEALLEAVAARFAEHPHRHEGLVWGAVRERLGDRPGALRSLHEMERTGGQPDVVGRDEETGE